MTTRNRVPTAIEPLLRLPPEASLTILTGTLGCSTAWLTPRFVGVALGPTPANDSDQENGCVVVGMSDRLIHRQGLDISKAIADNQLAIIDGLSKQSFYSQNAISAVESAVTQAIKRLAERPLLVLDGFDVMLASGSATAQHLNLLLLRLRSLVHSVILTCSGDQPLLHAITQGTESSASPLETEASRFLTQQAHNARVVMSVRELATGAARDISGVLRVTRSAHAYHFDETAAHFAPEEMEALYLVQRDGSVKVFQRGSDAM